MEQITLLEANKPEKVQEAVNELLTFKNAGGFEVDKETLGLDKVDNTSDAEKPVSDPQREYIDQQDNLNVKLQSETPQTIDSDLTIAEDKNISFERGDDSVERVLGIENINGNENVEVGAENIPLRFHHAARDINQTVVGRNPKVSVKAESGALSEESVAFLSDVQNQVDTAKNALQDIITDNAQTAENALQAEVDTARAAEEAKVDKSVMESAEVANGVVSSVSGDYYTDIETDLMSLHICVRSIADGALLSEVILPLKLASDTSRGLMTKEQCQSLSDLLSRVAAIEGKTSRYIYTASNSPAATDIDTFVQAQGQVSPYEGVAVVIAGTYHIWHYYENDNIGWRDDGSDTVNQASNTAYGIVIGSNTTGKVFIESDGSMSVVGFDDLSGRITALENSRLNDVTVAGGTNNGTVKLTKNKNGTNTTADNIPVTGLQSAAFTPSTNYATSAQGAKADSAYQKPSGGITAGDLASGVTASLAKADTALQGIKVNGTPQNSVSGVVDITVPASVSQSQMETYVSGAIDAAIGDAMGGSY